MISDTGMELGRVLATQPWLLAGLCGVALVALGFAAFLDRRWR